MSLNMRLRSIVVIVGFAGLTVARWQDSNAGMIAVMVFAMVGVFVIPVVVERAQSRDQPQGQ